MGWSLSFLKWVDRIFCDNCHLKHIIEEEAEETGRRGGRLRQLLYDFKKKRKYSNWKEEALDCSQRGTQFEKDHAPVVRLTTQ